MLEGRFRIFRGLGFRVLGFEGLGVSSICFFLQGFMRTCAFHTALGEFIGLFKATGASRVQGPAFNILIKIITILLLLLLIIIIIIVSLRDSS